MRKVLGKGKKYFRMGLVWTIKIGQMFQTLWWRISVVVVLLWEPECWVAHSGV